jgi:peptidoglycan/LPS O-acetylase OafA/YrhL
MIQRIQSVWLLLAAAAAFLSLQFPFYSGNIVGADNLKHLEAFTAKSNMLLLILTAGEGIAALIALFLFKNRKLQFRIVLLTLLVSIINLVLYFTQTKQYTEGNYTLTAIFAILVPVFLILAMRGIRRDDKLVKSLDRLR